MKINNRQLGTKWEKAAVDFLRAQGYIIIEKNYRCRAGEIDIIARDADILCFVEVKYRKSCKYGSAVEAVGTSKQRIIRFVARDYLFRRCVNVNTQCRFDVVGFDYGEPTLIKNAF